MFPQVVRFEPTIYSTAIIEVGVYLGYEWNQICNEMHNEDMYAQDGEGSFTICKTDNYTSDIINEIVKAIFDHNPDINSITVIQAQ